MPIIAHRGAKGLAPENSQAAIKIGTSLNVAYVEFDVQKTKDNKLVIIHNPKTESGLAISENSLSKIQNDSPDIITLKTALDTCSQAPPLVEIKSNNNTASLVYEEIKNYPKASITSFHPEEILIIRKSDPKRECFLMQHKHPFGLIKKALECRANGIGFNKNWLFILPLIAVHAKQKKLKCYVYTLNNKLLAKLVFILLPNVYICTDYPNMLETNE